METTSDAPHTVRMERPPITDPFLKKLRARIDADPNLTESGLAVAAGLDNSAIRRLFNAPNSSPKISTARKICRALGTTLEAFMSEAYTREEQEIVDLAMQLPDHLRRQLLGYARGLVDAAEAAPKEEDEVPK